VLIPIAAILNPISGLCDPNQSSGCGTDCSTRKRAARVAANGGTGETADSCAADAISGGSLF
jgi:hypothetical protein